MHITAQEAIEIWPEGSREAAELVIEAYGEPDEVTPTTLTWREAGSWKRIVATATRSSTGSRHRTRTRWSP